MESKIYSVVSEGCCMNKSGCHCNGNKKLGSFDWLCDLPDTQQDTDYVEVQFKNTRKSFFLNSTKIPLEKGDMVAVESSPGHDIGEVVLVGRLVLLQMKKYNFNPQKMEVRRVYRKAKETDLEKYKEAKAKEQETMIKARQIADSLHLDMKIGDVEYQGDGNKAIFYYIADDRVDFRQLIKVFAETFHVRIEMKQIGARQEAGRIGGIGPCGRQLCCASWMNTFNSVSTGAARYQDISMNPQKLAGQCSKLKCCMNYELDVYIDALKHIPSREIWLEARDATYYHFKTDIFKRQMTYSTDKNFAANLVTLSAERVQEIITMNKRGERPEKLLLEKDREKTEPISDYENVVGQDDLTRFDRQKRSKNRSRDFDREGTRNRGLRNRDNRENRPPRENAENKQVPENAERHTKPTLILKKNNGNNDNNNNSQNTQNQNTNNCKNNTSARKIVLTKKNNNTDNTLDKPNE